MSFYSSEFLFFLPIVLLLYTAVFRRELFRDLLLLCSSYFFYMSWNWRYAGLILLATVLDYGVGIWLDRKKAPGTRRLRLLASLCINLGILGIFKYFNFFVDMGEKATSVFGIDISFLQHDLLLPVGISFYTFKTLSYTIDVYRREITHERNFIKYAVYVSFFPQLLAGPIVRAKDFLPQLRSTLRVTEEKFNSGLFLIFQGLFKKIVIADLLATFAVDEIFANPLQFSSWDLLCALYAYTFQIYNDFSGYSDIAIGVAQMLGFKTPQNFNRPYLSQTVREFWSRWHITLSTWLRDYLYISLGGNRVRPWRLKFNLMTTMVLGGLWHGAALNFVIWGTYHGILLVISRIIGTPMQAKSLFHKLCRQFVCFQLVAFGWLFFRISNIDLLEDYLRGLLSFDGGTTLHPLFYAVLLLAVGTHTIPVHFINNLKQRFLAQPVPLQALCYTALLLALGGAALGSPMFIYFQF